MLVFYTSILCYLYTFCWVFIFFTVEIHQFYSDHWPMPLRSAQSCTALFYLDYLYLPQPRKWQWANWVKSTIWNFHKNVANIRQDAYKRYWSNGVNDSEMPCILIIQGYMRWNNELNLICIRSFIVWLWLEAE